MRKNAGRCEAVNVSPCQGEAGHMLVKTSQNLPGAWLKVRKSLHSAGAASVGCDSIAPR
jgi:hypothetical protein